MVSIAIVDSGPLIAAASRVDPDHRTCLAALQSTAHQLVIPALCVAEVGYLIGQRGGASVEARFLRSLESFDVQAPPRIAGLVEQVAAFPLGATAASVVALAERLRTDLVMTLDRRYFEAIRPRHCQHFRILP